MRERRTKGAASVGESRAAARRRSERGRSSSASDDDGGGFQARCASGEQKGARVGCYLLVQLGPMVQDKEHQVRRVASLRLLGKAALRLSLVSHLEDLVMSTTRGVLFIHSAPSALCPHIEWAVGGVFGMPVRVDWIVQPIERACYRTEYSWAGPCGTAARLASALKGWQRVRFEVTEEATSGTEAERYSYTPALGMFHAITGIHGDIMIPEDRIKHAIALAALGGKDITKALHDLLGSAWDEELEPFRYAGDGAPVRWLHNVV
jgi:hypothetical protein